MALMTRVAQAAGLVRSVETVTNPVPVNAVIDSAILPPLRDNAATDVTVDEATGLDAVFRSLALIQTDTQQLTLDVWRGGQQLTGRDRPTFLDRPDLRDHIAAADVWGQTVVSLAARGNAYWRVHRGYDGQVINLEVLDPLAVMVTPHPKRPGVVAYHHDGTTYTAADVRHLRYLQLPAALYGLGPIQAARRALRSAITRQGYSDTWYDSTPAGVLSSDQNLTAEQAQAYKAQWMASNGPGKGPAVLGRGLTYSPMHLTPAEVQWIEASQQTVTSIARLFGIPPRMLAAAVEGSAMTYSNLAQDELSFVRHTLMGYLRPVEVALSELLPRGTDVRWNLDALLRADTATRYAAHAQAIDAGFLTVNEVRAIEGMQPIPTTQEVPA